MTTFSDEFTRLAEYFTGLSISQGKLSIRKVQYIAVAEAFAQMAGLTEAITAKTGDYTATDEDRTILCDATAGVITITLPAAASNVGRVYFVKKTDVSANIVTVDANASETIDDATTKALAVQYDAIRIQSDGSNWHIL